MIRRKPFNRSSAIRNIENWLRDRDMPRLQMSVIVVLTGLSALVFSFLMLRAGLDHMALRYPVAVALAYLVFLLLLKVWIWIQASRPVELGVRDAIDTLDIAVETIEVTARGCSHIRGADHGGSDQNWDWDWNLCGWDLDEAFFLILAAVAILGGAAICIAVIWWAPVLFAEILVDAVIMAGIGRRMKSSNPRWWLAGALRRTALPALCLALLLSATGGILQHLAPDAPSIGPVFRHLASHKSR